MVEQEAERWYDARDVEDLQSFEAALTPFYRDAYRYVLPRHRFGLHRPRLWGFGPAGPKTKERYPATTYSPTPLPGQYHRRWWA